MFEAVDLYCERLGPHFWAEPVNALTNASFLLAAVFAWRRGKQLDALTPAIWCLLALICAIGLGSAAFHTAANGLTRFLDVLPILLFQLVYLWLYSREFIGLRPWKTAALIIVYLAAALTGRQYPEVLNGSLIYAPAIVVILLLGVYHAARNLNERFGVLVAALAFVVSLLARTLDEAICPSFPLGTHFLWHLLNGLVVYLLMAAFLANRKLN